MPEARFVLKEPTSENKTLIYLLYRYGGNRLKYSTGEKIYPKFWNDKKQRVRETNSFPEYSSFNHRLNKIETSINNVYRQMDIDNIDSISPQLLKIELDKELNKTAKIKKQGLIEWIRSEIEISKIDKKKGTIKVYNSLVSNLEDFASKKRYDLSFESIDLNFYSQFKDYIFNDKKLTTNYFGRLIKTLKKFLSIAIEKGITTNIKFQSKEFKSTQEVVNHVYLNRDELDLIYKLDLSKKLYLDRVRDLFLIGCNTGLRFSDFTILRHENFKEVRGNWFISIEMQKGKDKVVIPVNSMVLSIWGKYKGELPRAISNQKINKYIKELVDLAGITENTIIKKTSGKTLIVSENSKSKFVSSHTARRSFATNAFKANVPTLSIMKITGHKTESSFLKYIKVSPEENAELMANHPFFK